MRFRAFRLSLTISRFGTFGGLSDRAVFRGREARRDNMCNHIIDGVAAELLQQVPREVPLPRRSGIKRPRGQRTMERELQVKLFGSVLPDLHAAGRYDYLSGGLICAINHLEVSDSYGLKDTFAVSNRWSLSSISKSFLRTQSACGYANRRQGPIQALVAVRVPGPRPAPPIPPR